MDQLPPGAPQPAPIDEPPTYAIDMSQPTVEPSQWKRFATPLTVSAVLLAKFGKLAFILLKSGKFAGTAISMVISIGAYSLLWGWKFAALFVLLMLIHEMGHAIQLKREGIPASAPVFIPFLGAAIAMKGMPRNALVEARVGLAGPILGTIAAAAMYVLAIQQGSQMLQAAAFTGFFLNLFNLLPVSPLDGGRAMAAVTPVAWLFGAIGIGLMFFVWPNPVLLIIAIIALMETWGRWKRRHEDAAYYAAVTPAQRMAVFATWLGLVIVLGALMNVSHLPRTLPQ